MEEKFAMIERIGKYSIVEKLSESEIGGIYKAHDTARSRLVVLRTVAPDLASDSVSKENLYRSCRSVAKLRHPNIVELFALGEELGVVYLAMEWLEGNDLRSLIAERPPIPLEAKLAIMIQVADALEHAHNNGVVHHNLRPSTVHVTTSGIVKVRDFERASLLSSTTAGSRSLGGRSVYSAPEQILGKPCGVEADIFTAGVLFYELLTYVHPFAVSEGENASEKILASSEIETVDRFPILPLGCWPILETCLQKEPGDRFPTIGEVGRALRDLLGDISEASEIMVKELKGALPYLQVAVERPGSGIKLAKLFRDVQKLSQGGETLDHLSLQGMMGILTDSLPILRSVSPEVAAASASSKEREPLSAAIPIWIKGRSGRPRLTSGGLPNGPAEIEPASFTSTALMEEIASAEESLFEEPSARAELAEPDTDASTQIEEQPESPFVTPAGFSSHAETEDKPVKHSVVAFPMESASSEVPHKSAPRSMPLLWIGCSLVLILGVFGAEHWIRNAFRVPSAAEAQLKSVRMSLAQKNFDDALRIGQEILARSPEDERARSLIEEARQGKKRVAVDTLLQEAQSLMAQGNPEGSKAILRTVFGLEPENSAAHRIWENMNPGAAPLIVGSPPEQELRRLLEDATLLLQAGKLDQSKTEIDRVLRIDPNHPDALSLRKQWAARQSELTLQNTRKQRDETTAQRRQEREQQWSRQAEGLYKSGKYSELHSILDQWLADNPQSPAALALRAQAIDLQRTLHSYEAALKENRYDDALTEVRKAELVNPADPSLAELRRRAESRRAAARSSITVYRVGEPAVITLDDQPIGSNGEVENLSVPAGRHKLAIRNSRGLEAARTQDFLDGHTSLMVYDAAGPVLRPLTDTDREVINSRKAAEQVHRFQVDHKHMWLRGKCQGELLLAYNYVEYKPRTGDHGFRIPSRSLHFDAVGNKLELSFTADNRELRTFEVQNPEQAGTIQTVWEKFRSLTR